MNTFIQHLLTGNEIDDAKFSIKVDEEYMNKKNGKITKNINFKGTNIIGFMTPFEVNGNPKLIEIGYETGFEGKGSMGFGMVKDTATDLPELNGQAGSTGGTEENKG